VLFLDRASETRSTFYKNAMYFIRERITETQQTVPHTVRIFEYRIELCDKEVEQAQNELTRGVE